MVWMRAVTVTAAIIAIFGAALVLFPAIDHHDMPNQTVSTSMAQADNSGDTIQPSEPDSNCQIVQSCAVAVMPGGDPVLTPPDAATERPRAAAYNPSGTRNMPFHPPRILSQV